MTLSRRHVLRSAGLLCANGLAAPASKPPGFLNHSIRRGNGRGGWLWHQGEIQFLHRQLGGGVKPFGIARMDNGEVILAASWDDGSSAESARDREKPVMAFSRDGGQNWSEFQLVEGARGRPVMFTDLGGGRLFFQTDLTNPIHQFFSEDYGRSWPEQRVLQPPKIEGSFAGIDGFFGGEGNAVVERGANGGPSRVGVLGFTYRKGTKFPADPAVCMLRWSTDGGRTWSTETTPPQWYWKEEHQGKTYTRGISEGSLVRAANGWLVAALRTDMPYRFVELQNDNLEGIALSLSKDDGQTWSPLNMLYRGGRMHANLLRLPNGHLVMTYIVRQDYEGTERVGYRRGCEAIVSRDHGQTWNLRERYVLDEFEYSDGTPLSLACGHLSSTLLPDGRILTTYGNYLAKAAVVIRWRPAAS
ncbi:MAG: exo-alpha-sialidase [Acidobacteria bacterium]|nr:exo-alpha-sialidase [Acidobacteriota bacterium]